MLASLSVENSLKLKLSTTTKQGNNQDVFDKHHPPQLPIVKSIASLKLRNTPELTTLLLQVVTYNSILLCEFLTSELNGIFIELHNGVATVAQLQVINL